MLFRSINKLTIDFPRFPVVCRLSGSDVRAWLQENTAVHGWYLCYDADTALMKARPQCCLAYLMGTELEWTTAAVKASGLVGRGVKASGRQALLVLGTAMLAPEVVI